MNRIWIGVLIGVMLVSVSPNIVYADFFSFTDDLVGYWKLDSNSATQLDSSGFGNNGIVNGATWTSSGKYGGAYTFDGINDVIAIPSSVTLNITGDITISAWVKLHSTTDWGTIVDNYGSGGYRLGFNDANKVRWLVRSGTLGVQDDQYSDNALVQGTWNHVVVVYNSTNKLIYVNGISDATPTEYTNGTSGFGSLNIGALISAGKYLNATIDDVRIYNKSLSEQEILEIPPLWNDTAGYLGSTEAVIDPTENNTLFGKGYDETGLDWAWLSTNESGSWRNYTFAYNTTPSLWSSIENITTATNSIRSLYNNGTLLYIGDVRLSVINKDDWSLNTQLNYSNYSYTSNKISYINQDDDYLYYLGIRHDGKNKDTLFIVDLNDFSSVYNLTLTQSGTGFMTAVSVNDTYIFAGNVSTNGKVDVYNKTWDKVTEITVEDCTTGADVLDSDSDYLYVGCDETLYVYNMTWDNQANITGATDVIESINNDDDFVYYGYGNKFRVVNKTDWTVAQTKSIGTWTFSIYGISHTEDYVFVSGMEIAPNQYYVKVYDKSDWSLTTTVSYPTDEIYAVDSDGTYLYIGADDNVTYVVNHELFTYTLREDMNDVVSTWSWSNFTWSNSSVPSGSTVTWKIYYNDTSGNENVTSQQTFTVSYLPRFYSITEPTDPKTYNPSNTYQFNATVNMTSGEISKVFLEFDSVNHTMSNSSSVYYYTVSSLAAGTYNYKFYANSTGNVWDSSSSYNYTVSKNTSLTLTSDRGWVIGTMTPATVTCYGTIGKTLYKDSVATTNPYTATFTAGTYNFTCEPTDFVNYTSANHNMVVSLLLGCTNTNTYAFNKTVTPSGKLLNLDFSALANSSHVRADLSDVYINSTIINDTWTNFTAGSFIVVNTTGVTSPSR